MNETERMKELVKKLNEAAKAYYQEDREIMSNLEYDTLYDELQVLEEKTGVTLAGSPTTKVGYEAMDELPKEAHESPLILPQPNGRFPSYAISSSTHGFPYCGRQISTFSAVRYRSILCRLQCVIHPLE